MSFVEVMRNDQLLSRFYVRALKLTEFVESLHDADIPSPCEMLHEITDIGEHRVHCKNGIAQQFQTSMFRKCDDLLLPGLGIKKLRQILRVSVAVQTNGLMDKRIIFMLLQVCPGSQRPVGYLNGGSYLHPLCRLPKDDQTPLSSSRC